MQFRDLNAQYKKHKKEIDSAISGVLSTSQFIGGIEVSTLEERLAQYVGVRHCITCANGTEAMTLVLMAWNIGKNDAVFVPDFTFFSTGEVVAFRAATPVFVDVDSDTFNIDTVKLEKAIIKVQEQGKLTPKAIIPVDLFGLSANYKEILRIAKKYNLKILEDSAQGFGGSINGQKNGSFADAATTSFFPVKPLGCYGDGGAIFTDNDDLADTIKSLKVHGKGTDKYDNIRVGVNSRLDSIQAAILHVKLTIFIAHELEDINQIYMWYTERLKDIVKTPVIPQDYESSFAQYTIQLKNKQERDNLHNQLKERGIPTMIYYVKPMHMQKAFAEYQYSSNDFQIANNLSDVVLSLPMHPYMRREDITKISETICTVLN